MTFYHGTTKENWDKIQKEGVLYGKDKYMPERRVTYLATDIEEAKCYGSIILKIEYDPFKHPEQNNYRNGCWQIRVYEPIELDKCNEIKENNTGSKA